MKIVALIAPATWPAVVAALRGYSEDEICLVASAEPPAPLLGAPGALMGRGSVAAQPVDLADATARDLLDQAASALESAAACQVLHGPAERAVVQACTDADVLVLARDGDHTRLGPGSLSHQTRFIVDHAPCTVELVWPSAPPSVATIPAPPRGR